MFRIRAQIERLMPDSIKVASLEKANAVVAAVLQANVDRDVRLTVSNGRGEVISTVERKASSFTPCVIRQETGFYG